MNVLINRHGERQMQSDMKDIRARVFLFGKVVVYGDQTQQLKSRNNGQIYLSVGRI